MKSNKPVIFTLAIMIMFFNFNLITIYPGDSEKVGEDKNLIDSESQYHSTRVNEPVTFTNRSPELGIPSITGDSFAWGDYNNDGYLDFLVRGNTTIGNRLFRNNGPPDYNFTDVTNQSNISSRGYCLWADYDNDGFLDFFSAGDPDSLWKNNGPPGWNFSDVTVIAGNLDDTRPSEAAGWGDYDRDGFVDLYVNSWYQGDTYYWDILWHNNGDGTFTDVSSSSGINTVTTPAYKSPPFAGMAVAWGDYNNDGWMDIYVGKYHITPNSLFRNNHDGTFTDVAMEVNVTGDPDIYQGSGPYYGHSAGAGWGDYNGDGFFDLWVSNLAHKDDESSDMGRGYFCDDAQLFRSNGAPHFEFVDVRPETGIPIIPVGTVYYDSQGQGWWKDEDFFGVTWGDCDNDGDIDLWLPQIKTYHEFDYSYLYRNNFDGTFTDISEDVGIRVWSNSGGCWADYDNDGFLDLITEGTYPFQGPRQIHLFQSSGNSNNWLQLQLTGTTSNTAAIGARVNLTTNGISQHREIGGDAGGHGFQNSFTVEFGLGTDTEVDRIEITWPSGTVQVLEDIDANQILDVTEIDPAPVITDISVSKTDVDEDEEISFGATASYSGGSISKYEWDFDCDGVYDWSSSSSAATTHTYTKSGVYFAKLRVWDNTGKIGDAESTEFITVNNIAPTAYAGVDIIGDEDEDIALNASGCVDTPSDQEILLYFWEFDDGTNSSWTSNVTVFHSYPDRGTYLVDLTIRDDDGEISMDQVKVTVLDPSPTCDAGEAKLVYEDELVAFNGSGTDTPSDMQYLNYKWDYGDGSEETEWSQSPNASHVYTDQGVYNATLSVIDDHSNTGESKVQVNVLSREPESFVEQELQTVYEDQTVYLNGSGNDTPSDKPYLSYYWDFGDGANSGWLDYMEGPDATHKYTDQGDYTAILIVKDDNSLTKNASAEITVVNAAPTAYAGWKQTVNEDESVYLSGTGSDTPSDIGALTYYWDFGNGYTTETWLTEPNATCNYTEDGEYYATLTAKDDNDATDSSTVRIVVKNIVPTAKFNANRTVIDEDESINFDAGKTSDTKSDLDTLTYMWEFEDEEDAGIEHQTEHGFINHTFTRAGTFDIKLTVIDDNEAKDTAKVVVSVNNVKPTAELHIEKTDWLTNDEIVVYANESWDTPSDRVNLTFKWNFGDSPKSTDYTNETMMTYTYTEPGEYNIVLTAMDDNGDKDSDQVIITVEPHKPEAEDASLALEFIAIPIIVVIIILIVISFLIFRRKRQRETEEELGLVEEQEGVESGAAPMMVPPFIPPIAKLPEDKELSDEQMRVQAAQLAQDSLEKIEAAKQKGIDVTRPLQTLEEIRAAMMRRDYQTALKLARLCWKDTDRLVAIAPVPQFPPPSAFPQPMPLGMGMPTQPLPAVTPTVPKQELLPQVTPRVTTSPSVVIPTPSLKLPPQATLPSVPTSQVKKSEEELQPELQLPPAPKITVVKPPEELPEKEDVVRIEEEDVEKEEQVKEDPEEDSRANIRSH